MKLPESVSVEVAGDRLAVQVLGPSSGEPVLLVAGGAGEASAWRFLVPEVRRLALIRQDHCGRSLAEQLRVAVYDQRGVGGSSSLAPLLSALSAADDALAVGQGVHGERFHLVGISLGGMVALELAAQHPEALASLTLLATSAGGLGLTPPDPAFLANVLGQSETDPAARLRENIALSLSPRFPAAPRCLRRSDRRRLRG